MTTTPTPKALAQAQALQAQVAQAQMLAQAQVPINWSMEAAPKGWKLASEMLEGLALNIYIYIIYNIYIYILYIYIYIYIFLGPSLKMVCFFGSQDSPKIWCFLFRNLGRFFFSLEGC